MVVETRTLDLPIDRMWLIDAEQVWNRLPREVRALMRSLPGRLIVAGGFVRDALRGEKPRDIDLFVSNADPGVYGAGGVIARSLRTVFGGNLIKTVNAYTVVRGDTRPAVQVMDRWGSKTPNDIIRGFDFTMTRAAVWWGEDEGGMHGPQGCVDARFYADAMAKRLVYCDSHDSPPGDSLARAIRFIGRGYTISAQEFGKMTGATFDIPPDRGEEEVGRLNPSNCPPAYPDPSLPTFSQVDGSCFIEAAKALEEWMRAEEKDAEVDF